MVSTVSVIGRASSGLRPRPVVARLPGGRAVEAPVLVPLASVAQFLSGEVDEDCLERRLVDRQVRDLVARSVRSVDDARQRARAGTDERLHATVDDARLRDLDELVLEHRGEGFEIT